MIKWLLGRLGKLLYDNVVPRDEFERLERTNIEQATDVATLREFNQRLVSEIENHRRLNMTLRRERDVLIEASMVNRHEAERSFASDVPAIGTATYQQLREQVRNAQRAQRALRDAEYRSERDRALRAGEIHRADLGMVVRHPDASRADRLARLIRVPRTFTGTEPEDL